MTEKERRSFMTEKFEELYADSPKIWVRAPGRVDLMGSHTDYNLGFVMTMPVDRDTWIAAAPEEEKKMTLFSLNLEEKREADLHEILKPRKADWIHYAVGVAWAMQGKGVPLKGWKGIVHTTIPIGSGLSSSAAFECASAVLIQKIGDRKLPPLETAELCQKAENQFVGMNCGILDQYSSLMGEAGRTILLDCKELIHKAVPFPADMSVVICNTNAPRKLTGSEYGDRRAQCEEGVRVLGRHYPGIKSLRDVKMEQFLRHEGQMPPLAAKRSRFILEENARVLALAEALGQSDRKMIGELFDQSFRGARDLFQISIPAMESMIEAMNGAPGIIGSRQAGAGFGGCMVAIVEKDKSTEFTRYVLEKYREKTGLDAEAYTVQSSPGAGALPS